MTRTSTLKQTPYLVLFVILGGIGISSVYGLLTFDENIEVDTVGGNSEVEITSSSGDATLTLTDQGTKSYQIIIVDGKKKLVIFDDTKNKPRITIKNNGNVGIGLKNPSEKLHVKGNIIASNNIEALGNITLGSSLDDTDYLFFDGGGEFLLWNDTDSRFELSDELQTSGNITLGISSLDDDDYLFFDGGGEFLFWNDTAGVFEFSDDLIITPGGILSIGTDDPDNEDVIAFDDGTQTLKWDDFNTRFGFSDNLHISGNILSLGTDDGGDDDIIQFDAGSESLQWDNAQNRFEFTEGLEVQGVIQTGSVDTAPVGFNRFGDDDSPFVQIVSSSDLLVSGSLGTSSSDIFSGDDIFVGTDSGDDDDAVWFDGSPNEFLNWDNVGTATIPEFPTSAGLFRVSDDLFVDNDISVAGNSFSDDDTIFFDFLLEEFLSWDNSQDRFEFSDKVAFDKAISTGSLSSTAENYNRFGNGQSDHGMLGVFDAYVSDDLEVEDDFFVEDIFVGSQRGDDDDVIWFDDSAESFFWEDAMNRFTLSNDLQVTGMVTPPAVAFTAETHDSIKQMAVDFTGNDEVITYWNTDNRQMEVYIIAEDSFFTFSGEPVPYVSTGISANSMLNYQSAKDTMPVNENQEEQQDVDEATADDIQSDDVSPPPEESP